MPNTRGHKVIIRDKSLIGDIKKVMRKCGVEPESAIEAMAPAILSACRHATMGEVAKSAPENIRGAAVLKEIYLIALEMASITKPINTKEQNDTSE